uniref:STIL centriolar assembly protein n=1 Tax=Haplochromis burtoni TaxID=8153 RepID=A0A3Q3CGZ0_HAPBU
IVPILSLVVYRNSVNPRTPLSFPKSRSALWDSSPMGEKLRLHLSSHRKPQLVLLEKTLRLAHRHTRRSNKPHLHCFLLGTVSVDSDEEGITITLDRFDPGRDQAGASGQVPSAPLPGDVLVPCLFSSQTETVVQSEAELHHCFKVLQQFVSSRQTLDLSQLLKVKGHVACCEQSDAATFTLSWSIISPSVSVEVEPVRSVPIIPTALFRSLTNVSRPLGSLFRFLTMDQTRKLLLLLESDPKASSLPLVGLWLSGVTHIYNPQVWAWCLRFMFSSTLQDRVLSDGGFFLLVVFGCARRAPQFFRCRGSGPQLDCQLLTASHTATLYQAVQVDGKTLQVELTSEDHSRKLEVFREAQISFSRAPPPSAALSVTDQDSGVEDDDLSPRPSPSPHTPAHQVSHRMGSGQLVLKAKSVCVCVCVCVCVPAVICCSFQARRVEPSVPELSLLIDSSFTCTQPNPASACKPPAHPRGNSSSAPRTPPYLQSTPNPNSNPQQPCNCCSNHPYNCTAIIASPGLPPAASPVSHHNDPSASSLIHAPPPPPPPSNHPSLSVPPAPTTRSVPPSFTCPAPSPSHQHVSPPHSSTSFPHSYAAADPVPSPWLSQPSCMNQCCYQASRVVPPDTYQLLLHQEHQLRLLQAQVTVVLFPHNTTRIYTTLASINPAAVLSRLSVSEPTASALCPGGSVDLSLEANAIALHYLSDSQLSRLSLGGHIPHSSLTPSSTSDSLPSPSNMSLATRKYMRKYGLIEEEDGEDEVEQKEVGVQETSDREPLTEAVNARFLPQSQLIQDLRPKMQLLANHTEPHTSDKKNHSNRQPSFVRANLRQTEGSLGNILDLSRLRQLPKLF